MSSDRVYDAVVIGGGPAGTSAAALLAQAGHSVLLVEQQPHPRFHIGESLIPGVLPYLARIGVAERVRRAGFIEKYAAEFVTPDRAFRQRYVFGDSLTPDAPLAYQVERDQFDHLLLEHALESGAELKGARVARVEQAKDNVTLLLDTPQGEAHAHGRFLIDASGQRSLLAASLGLREMNPALKNIAVYSHFSGAKRGHGPAQGDITIVLDPEGWWWVIPLRQDITSLGFVAPRAAFSGRPDSEWMLQRMSELAVLREQFADATQLAEVRVAADYSYQSRQFAGDRWLLVGDAAVFLDPVFSTGVFLALGSGVRAAEALLVVLAGGERSQAFGDYQHWLGEHLQTYAELVQGFYCPEFVDLFMHPSDSMQMRQAVTSALAGFADHSEVRWRVRAFLNAVRANRTHELSPRLPGRREAAARLQKLATRSEP